MADDSRSATGRSGRFVHQALFYRDLGDYLARLDAFVTDGLASGEPVLVAVHTERLGPLRERLGASAAQVHFQDMAEVGRNPGRIMTVLTDFAGQCDGTRPRLVGEPIWAGRSPAEVREATRHEALLNLAFAGTAATILCPYATGELDAGTLADAERTHPELLSAGWAEPSPHYTPPIVVSADCDAPQVRPPPDRELIPIPADDQAAVRRRVAGFATAAGMSADRIVDLILAVAELADNAVRHGTGEASTLLWLESGQVVAEVHDQGRISDPLAGRRRPALNATGGRGLWLVHQLCELVEYRPGMVRLRMALS